ncbi:50S ribosomal protein L10 [Buchnera aphidicola]|uniref:50S ribosomal protein L10 n=1 Tax=Buchnera aphidicola TaxID=9 RepID=UPI003464D13A
MTLNLDQKKKIVFKMHEMANKTLSAVLADSTGVNVNKINILRKKSRKNNVKINIIKNTLLKMSINKTPLECLKKKIAGSILIGYSLKEPENAVKLFHNFSKKNKNFKIKAATLYGKILSSLEIEKLANLPSYKEAIIRFIHTIKTATIGKLKFILLQIKQMKSI